MDPVETPGDRVARRITVRGVVQGVGYRWFARETARALGVVGWARNMPDGTVCLEAMASRAAMARFVAELQKGPAAAQVSDVHVAERDDAAPLPDRFTIVR